MRERHGRGRQVYMRTRTHQANEPCERAAWHLCGDCRDASLMPADAGVDNGGSRIPNGDTELGNLLPGGTFFHEVEHGQTEHNDKVITDRSTHLLDDLNREANAILVASAIDVLSLVGLGHDELETSQRHARSRDQEKSIPRAKNTTPSVNHMRRNEPG